MDDTDFSEKPIMSKIDIPRQEGIEAGIKDSPDLMSIHEKREENSVPLASLGSVFLKAAISELTEDSLLSKILSSSFEGERVLEINNPDILLFLELFGLSDPQSIKQSAFSGIWRLNNVLYNNQDLSAIEKIKKGCSFNKLKLAAAIELPQLFKEVNKVGIHLSNGKEINLDGSFSSIWKEQPPFGLSSPMFSVVSRINSEIITNVQTWSIDFINDGNIDLFGHLCQAVDNTSTIRLDKIVLSDFKNDEISTFPFIPGKKRVLFCGLLPDQASFKTILKASKLSQEYHETQGEDKYYYRESVVPINSFVMSESTMKVKVYFVSKRPEDAPFLAVITNNPDVGQGYAAILSGFILQALAAATGFKGYFQGAGRQDASIRKKMEEKKMFHEQQSCLDYDLTRFISCAYNFNEILQIVLDQLNIFCQYRYFPLSCAALTREEMMRGFLCPARPFSRNKGVSEDIV